MFENIYSLREKYGYEELILKYSKIWNTVNCNSIPYKIVYVPKINAGISFSLTQENLGLIINPETNLSFGYGNIDFENELSFDKKKKEMYVAKEIENTKMEKNFIESQLIESILLNLSEASQFDISNLEFFIFNSENKNIHFDDEMKVENTKKFIEFVQKDLFLQNKIKELTTINSLTLEKQKNNVILDDDVIKINHYDKINELNIESNQSLDWQNRKINIFNFNNMLEKKKNLEVMLENEKNLSTEKRMLDMLNNDQVKLKVIQNNFIDIREIIGAEIKNERLFLIEGENIMVLPEDSKIKEISLVYEQLIGDIHKTYNGFLEESEISSETIKKIVGFEDTSSLIKKQLSLDILNKIDFISKVSKSGALESIERLENLKKELLSDSYEQNLTKKEKELDLIYEFVVEATKKKITETPVDFSLSKVNREICNELDFIFEKAKEELRLDDADFLMMRDNIKKGIIEQTVVLKSNADDFELVLSVTEDLIRERIDRGIKFEEEFEIDAINNGELLTESEFFTEKSNNKETKIEQEIRAERTKEFELVDSIKENFLKTGENEVEISNDLKTQRNNTLKIEIIDSEIKNDIKNKETLIELSKVTKKKEYEKIKIEIEERLKLHGRFWMFRRYGEKDKINIPNNDFNYLLLPLYFSPNDDNIRYKYKVEYTTPQEYIKFMFYIKGEYYEVIIEEKNKVETENYLILFEEDKITFYHNEVDYLFIKTTDSNIIANFEKNILDSNPFEGEYIGIRDIEVSFNVIVDFINIYLLVWSKFYESYGGMNGTQSLKRFLGLFYEWVTLDGMSQEPLLEEYQRVYRWIRWEAEKIFMEARHDVRLNGNFYLDKLLYNLIYYLEINHFDNIAIYNQVSKMDEFFEVLETENLNIVTTKFKTIHDRIKEDL